MDLNVFSIRLFMHLRAILILFEINLICVYLCETNESYQNSNIDFIHKLILT
jgi:hypothetical protein